MDVDGSVVEYFVFLSEVFVELEDGGYVSATVTIIWSAPNGDDGFVEHEFVAFHCELVSACDEVDVVVVCEGFGDVGAEEEACAAWREAPALDVVWV